MRYGLAAAAALAAAGAAAQESMCGLAPGMAPAVVEGDLAAAGGTAEGLVETPATDFGHLSFTLAAPGAVVIDALAPPTGGDPFAQLLGPDGAVIAEDDDGGGSLSPRIASGPLAPGTYCVAVRNVNGAPIGVTVRIALGGAGAPSDLAAQDQQMLEQATPQDPAATGGDPGGDAAICGLPAGAAPLLADGALDIATAPDFVEGIVQSPPETFGYASVALSDFADVRFEAVSTSGGDAYLQLIDAGGAIVWEDDDSGGALASRIEPGTLAPGFYCLGVRNIAGPADSFTLRAGRMEHAPLTAGLDGGATPVPAASASCGPDTPALGLVEGPFEAALAGGATVVEDVTPAFGSGRRIALSAPTALSFTAENDAADPVLRLYDARGALVAENDDFDGVSSRIDLSEPVAAGDYCLETSALNDSSQPIRVSALTFDEARWLASLYRRGQAAPPLDGSWPVAEIGAIGRALSRDYVLSGGDVKWMTVDIPERSLVLVQAQAMTPGADPKVQIHEPLGRLIESNDDYADALDARVAPLLEPGRYVIGLAAAADSGPAGVRLTIRRFVEAP